MTNFDFVILLSQMSDMISVVNIGRKMELLREIFDSSHFYMWTQDCDYQNMYFMFCSFLICVLMFAIHIAP